MTALDVETIRRRAAAPAWAAALYAVTVFASAALLFFLEPMFAKMVLPLLGGSAAVWSVAMVVFQGLLLAGYLYAHLLTRALPVRRAALVHLIVCAAGLVSLPIAAAAGTPPAHGVSLWLIGLFLGAVGLPCFALSANAPLLQAWFASRRGAAPAPGGARGCHIGARPLRLDRPGLRAIGIAGRRDGPYRDRCRFGAVPVDRAAGALSADLRAAVRGQAGDPRQAHAGGAAGHARRAGAPAALDRACALGPGAGRPSGRVLRRRHGVPRTA